MAANEGADSAPPGNETETLRQRVAQLEALVRDHDLLPFPPVELRVRVGGSDDLDHFLGVGRKVYSDLKRRLLAAGRSVETFTDILDFGCGCGRTIRHFPAGSRRLVGCDIDAESVDWCRANLGGMATFHVTGSMPPLPFAAGQFDLVYVISVFTHLPEDMQFAWLDELARVTRTGGIVIASTHGESLLAGDVAAENRAQLAKEGFLFVRGPGTPGLPDFYHTAFHLESYVRAKWCRHFRLVAAWPRGINNHQDAYVLERL